MAKLRWCVPSIPISNLIPPLWNFTWSDHQIPTSIQNDSDKKRFEMSKPVTLLNKSRMWPESTGAEIWCWTHWLYEAEALGLPLYISRTEVSVKGRGYFRTSETAQNVWESLRVTWLVLTQHGTKEGRGGWKFQNRKSTKYSANVLK